MAGKAVVRTSNGLAARLVNIDRDLVLIPNLSIHMNRELNNGYTYHVQKDLLPLYGMADAAGTFKALVAEALRVAEADLLGTDLFLYNRVPGSIWGAREEFIASGRLDDLQCAWSIIQALKEGGNETGLCMGCVFDNEEVGSLTKQGASSTFLSDTLARIAQAVDMSREELQIAVASGFMISADNAHALHPQHPDKADACNRPLLNHGPVIKYNAAQKYTTDSVFSAIFKELCRLAQVPCQTLVNRSDIPGGSTLGNLSNAQVSLNAVDIGLPQLAMHSPYETAGVKDTAYLIDALTAFYHTPVRCEENRFVLGVK